ncbi:unnamed protein product, partial [Ectocarpus fasciculatus]
VVSGLASCCRVAGVCACAYGCVVRTMYVVAPACSDRVNHPRPARKPRGPKAGAFPFCKNPHFLQYACVDDTASAVNISAQSLTYSHQAITCDLLQLERYGEGRACM